MFSGRKIVILVGESDNFSGTNYLLKEYIPAWESLGLEVLIHRGLGTPPDADLAVLHIDLTVIPPAYLTLAAKYRRVINMAVHDISKRRNSTDVVRLGDGYRGPVIVKTNRNSAGIIESEMASRSRGWTGWSYKLRRKLPWYCRAYLRRYRIFERTSEVPVAVWFNRDLVVERFEPERDGDLYCLRTWVFLGDHESHSRSASVEPIIKSGTVVCRETLGEVPDELRAIRRKLGFDYGKFDYGLVNDRVVLYDTNRTPSLGAEAGPALKQAVLALAGGIKVFL